LSALSPKEQKRSWNAMSYASWAGWMPTHEVDPFTLRLPDGYKTFFGFDSMIQFIDSRMRR